MATALTLGAVLVLWSRELQDLRVRLLRRRAGGGSAPALPTVPAPPRVAAALRRGGVGEPDLVFSVWVAVLSLCVVAAPMVPTARVATLVVLLAPMAALAAVGDRHARRRTRQLPDALDAVATALRGGTSLPAAIAGAGAVGAPLGAELEAVARAAGAGRPLDEALQAWASRAADPATGMAAAALTVAARVGGPGARAIDGAAASLRDRLAAEAEVDALATQGRVSAIVLTVAPIGFAVLLSGLDARAGRFLLGTPTGWLCIAAGLALDGLGAWWMSTLVRRSR